MKAILILLFIAGFVAAQPTHTIYFQLLGAAGRYSLNYEQILPINAGMVGFSASAGASVDNNTVIDIPILLQAQIGARNQLLAGVGAEPEWYVGSGTSDYQTLLFGSIGYRHCFKMGLILGIAVIPLYEIETKSVYTSLGLNIGWGF